MMQTDPAQIKAVLDYFVSLGPTGLLAGYLVYKDLYKPWRVKKANRYAPQNGAAYVRESDFSGLSQSVRDFKEQYRIDMDDLKERLLTLERNSR
jgi:hypothetical protein